MSGPMPTWLVCDACGGLSVLTAENPAEAPPCGRCGSSRAWAFTNYEKAQIHSARIEGKP